MPPTPPHRHLPCALANFSCCPLRGLCDRDAITASAAASVPQSERVYDNLLSETTVRCVGCLHYYAEGAWELLNGHSGGLIGCCGCSKASLVSFIQPPLDVMLEAIAPLMDAFQTAEDEWLSGVVVVALSH